MAKIVIINGYPQSGKDTFVNLCSRYAKVDNILTSTPAKDALRLLGWNGEKTEEVRDLLSTIMAASYRLFDGPVKYVSDKICESTADIVFIHVREPENIELFKNEVIGRVVTLFVNRDSKRGDYSNDSDRCVESYTYDITIDNNKSLEDLDKIAEHFTTLLLKGLV